MDVWCFWVDWIAEGGCLGLENTVLHSLNTSIAPEYGKIQDMCYIPIYMSGAQRWPGICADGGAVNRN